MVVEHREQVSVRSRLVHAGARLVARPAVAYWPATGPATQALAVLEAGFARLPRARGIRHLRVRTDTWHAELLLPPGAPAGPGAVMYLHGGAFLTGGVATHRRICERLVATTGLPVLNVGYRQLPAGTLTDSLNDCLAAHAWLVDAGYPADQVVLVGDSAGGHLAFATTVQLLAAGTTPAGVVGLSPWLDFDHLGKVAHRNVRRDAYIPARRLARVARLVVGADPLPEHSPVNATLAGFPPVLLMCAADEVLRADAELMTTRLRAARGDVRLVVWHGQVHAFPVLAGLLPESRAAIGEVAAFVAAATTRT